MPFGEELGAGVGGRTTDLKYSPTNADNIRQRFTGYEKDTETDLDFAEARMYQNKHGRFTAVDPLLASASATNPQTFNRYIYTGNNPVNYTDPLGLRWVRDSSGDTYWIPDDESLNGREDLTGKTRTISSSGCDEVAGCATVGDVVTFNSTRSFKFESRADTAVAESPSIDVDSLGGVISEFIEQIAENFTGTTTMPDVDWDWGPGGQGDPNSGLPVPTDNGDGVPDGGEDSGGNDSGDGGSVGDFIAGVAIQVVMKIAKDSLKKALYGEELEDGYIYIAGGFTAGNFTPRPGDGGSLSANRTVDGLQKQVKGKTGGSYQKIDVNSLRGSGLVAVLDNKATGHVSIIPRDRNIGTMLKWTASRNIFVHKLTKQLMDARIGSGKFK